MAKQAPKLNDQQKGVITKFFELAGWSPENAEAQKKEQEEKVKALEESLKSLRANLAGFDGREIRAQEALVFFDSGYGDAPEAEKLNFLCNRFSVKAKAKAAAAGGPVAKASNEEKEAILECLDREGRSVSKISTECGKTPKDCARVLKSLIHDGTVKSAGERRGMTYMLVASEIDDEDIEEGK